MIWMLILLFSSCSSPVFFAKSYAGYKLLRFHPQNATQVQLLSNLVPDSEDSGISFWSESPVSGESVDILVAPSKYEEVVRLAQQSKLPAPKIVVSDVQEVVNPAENVLRSNIRQAGGTESILDPNEFFNNFRRLGDIYSFMDRLVRMYPNLVSVQSIGNTSERREMRMLRISSSQSTTRPIFWIDAGIHAREWAAPSTALFLAYALVSQYGKQVDVTKIVDSFEWHILPVANPDGYEYTFTDDRLWRKTRSRGNHAWCRGVDPNRNFGFHWGERGTSKNPCSETYAGPKAFSEAETMNIASHLWSIRQRLLTYVALHAFGNMWLTPWGFTSDLPTDYNDLFTKARRAADAVQAVYGTKYRVGSSTRVLYAAAGGSDDWAKGVAGAKYSYTVELRPGGNGPSGFVLRPAEIRPCGLETLAGIVKLAKDIANSEPSIETRTRQSRKRSDRISQ